MNSEIGDLNQSGQKTLLDYFAKAKKSNSTCKATSIQGNQLNINNKKRKLGKNVFYSESNT